MKKKMVYVIQLASRTRTFRPGPARKLSANLYDIYHCCVYSEKLLMMDRTNCTKHVEFYSKNKLEKLVHLVGFIVRIYHDTRSPDRQNFLYLHAFSVFLPDDDLVQVETCINPITNCH